LSFVLPSGAPPASAALANKRELAALLGTTLPTLTAWIDRYGDAFPVEERGTNGRDWKFDPEQVITFLTARRDAEERAEADRAAFLEQFRLPGLDPADAGTGATKASELLAIARLQALQRKEALENGLLVPTSDVRMALTAALGKLNRAMNAAILQAARKHGLADATLRDIQASFHDAQREFVRAAGRFRPEDGADGDTERGLFTDATGGAA
jgi:phage terminase Nu1 subunit (DNA packaging protein)